jgi:hypothetical protein
MRSMVLFVLRGVRVGDNGGVGLQDVFVLSGDSDARARARRA